MEFDSGKQRSFRRLLIAVGVACWTTAGSGAVIFESKFDGTNSDQWEIGQPENYFVDREEEVFSARMLNRVPENPPERYAVVQVDFDPTESFSLRWDEFVEFESYGKAIFGLFSSDLLAENRTWTSLPPLRSASTVSIGLGGNGHYEMTAIDRLHKNHSQGGFGDDNHTGRWLKCEINYDSVQNEVNFLVTGVDEEAGVDSVFDITRPMTNGFNTGMVFLGFSGYPIGMTPNQVWSVNRNSIAYAKVDNVVLEGSRLSEAIRKPGLEVTAVHMGDTSVLVDEPFGIAATIINRGSFEVFSNTARFFLSEDRFLDDNDYELLQTDESSIEVFFDPFMPEEERIFRGVASASGSTPSGRYYVICHVDTRVEIGQSNAYYDVGVSESRLTVNNSNDKPVIETGATAEIKTEQDGSRSFSFPFWAQEGVSHSVQSFGDITSRVGSILSNILGNGEFREARFPIDLTRDFGFFRIGVEKPQEPTEPEPAEILPSERFLSFPAEGKKAYTPLLINSVMDHSNTNDFNNPDNIIVAFSGESAKQISDDDSLRLPIRKGDSGEWLYGFPSDAQLSKQFSVRGLYNISSFKVTRNGSYLFYDGHTGYDYDIRTNEVIRAAAPGHIRAIWKNGVTVHPISGEIIEFNQVDVEHTNGFWTYYTHVAPTNTIRINQSVSLNTILGHIDHENHLHFTVKKEVNGILYRVDPYGWKGEGGDPLELLLPPSYDPEIVLWKEDEEDVKSP